jgi:hypothetical protein
MGGFLADEGGENRTLCTFGLQPHYYTIEEQMILKIAFFAPPCYSKAAPLRDKLTLFLKNVIFSLFWCESGIHYVHIID